MASSHICLSQDKNHHRGGKSQVHPALCTSGSRGFSSLRGFQQRRAEGVRYWKQKLDDRGTQNGKKGPESILESRTLRAGRGLRPHESLPSGHLTTNVTLTTIPAFHSSWTRLIQSLSLGDAKAGLKCLPVVPISPMRVLPNEPIPSPAKGLRLE